jgi:hypothetical protein
MHSMAASTIKIFRLDPPALKVECCLKLLTPDLFSFVATVFLSGEVSSLMGLRELSLLKWFHVVFQTWSFFL